MKRALVAVIAIAMAAVFVPRATTRAATTQPTFPIRAAFYYPWYPETTMGHYHPWLGTPYDSGSPAVVASHIASMQYAGIQAGISSWWGKQSLTDQRVPTLLRGADGTDFRWTLYYEAEGYSNPTATAIRSDLNYIKTNYGNDPNYLRVGTKPVIFVYADGADGCTMARRWKNANTVGFYVVLKVFAGYLSCGKQPQSWHQYGPSSPTHEHATSYAISPGFWHYNSATPTLARDLDRWNQNIRSMVASGKPWQLVTTFNEWGEGTGVESTTELGSAYLDALHNNGGVTPTSPPPTSPPPTSPPPSSSTPPPGGLYVGVAGDICDDANCGLTANLIEAQNPPLVLTTGDNVYNSGTASEFTTRYNPYWGRFKAKTQPSVGNHEYGTPNAQGYRDYFGLGSGPLYSSFDSGGWHFVRMDTVTMNATQQTWMNSDLAANTAQCEIGYGHYPRWSSGDHGSQTSQAGAWNVMAANNVDIVLYGHDHDYERFDLIDGMREFVVGTGGANPYQFHTPYATGSQVRINNTYGVLFLTLGDGTYTWQFLDTAGAVRDSGTGLCH